MDPYQNLLSGVQADLQSKELLPYAALSKYNIFQTLGIEAKEVIMCRFLADLWNPEGAHGCGILFLRTFLQQVLHKDGFSDTLLAHTDIIKEYPIKQDRRIDIVIQNARFFIPVEVKIYAGEQEGQCFDYAFYAKTRDKDARLVYLTRFGTEPSEYSRKQKDGAGLLSADQILCISWEHDICGWLAGLLPKLREPLASLVMQYIDAIHEIADRREELIMEKTLERLYASADFFQAGLQIEAAMKAAKLRLIQLVLDDFRYEMDLLAPDYGLEFEKNTHYYFYKETCHEKFYDCYSTYPGLNYVVPHAAFQKKSLQMWFRIEVEHRLFAGFCLFDTEAPSPDGSTYGYQADDINPGLIDEAARYLDRDIIRPADWWFTYCYPNGRHQEALYADVPDFKEMNPCAIQLVDAKKRKAFVKSAVRSFEEQLLKHLLIKTYPIGKTGLKSFNRLDAPLT